MATSLVCFEKPDFLNLTMGAVGMLLMVDPQQIRQSYLRLLMVMLGVSQLYDLVWLYSKSDEYWEDKQENGMS